VGAAPRGAGGASPSSCPRSRGKCAQSGRGGVTTLCHVRWNTRCYAVATVRTAEASPLLQVAAYPAHSIQAAGRGSTRCRGPGRHHQPSSHRGCHNWMPRKRAGPSLPEPRHGRPHPWRGFLVGSTVGFRCAVAASIPGEPPGPDREQGGEGVEGGYGERVGAVAAAGGEQADGPGVAGRAGGTEQVVDDRAEFLPGPHALRDFRREREALAATEGADAHTVDRGGPGDDVELPARSLDHARLDAQSEVRVERQPRLRRPSERAAGRFLVAPWL